jgi:archaellum component FlaC
MLKEIAHLRKIASGLGGSVEKVDEEEMQQLVLDITQRARVAEKEKQIEQLMNPDTDEQSRLIAENRRINREMDMWKIRATKLSQEAARKNTSSDSTRLLEMRQELDDLRHNYKESLRLNMQYEQRLASGLNG